MLFVSFSGISKTGLAIGIPVAVITIIIIIILVTIGKYLHHFIKLINYVAYKFVNLNLIL